MLLNVTGVLFASQLMMLLILGPYADYGHWRPWIMIGELPTPSPSRVLLRMLLIEHSFPSGPDYSIPLPILDVCHQQVLAVGRCPGTIRRRISSRQHCQRFLCGHVPIHRPRLAQDHRVRGKGQGRDRVRGGTQQA